MDALSGPSNFKFDIYIIALSTWKETGGGEEDRRGKGRREGSKEKRKLLNQTTVFTIFQSHQNLTIYLDTGHYCFEQISSASISS